MLWVLFCFIFLSSHIGLQTSFRSSSSVLLFSTISEYRFSHIIGWGFFSKYKDLVFMCPHWNDILNVVYKIPLRERQSSIACMFAFNIIDSFFLHCRNICEGLFKINTSARAHRKHTLRIIWFFCKVICMTIHLYLLRVTAYLMLE